MIYEKIGKRRKKSTPKKGGKAIVKY